MLTVFCFQVSLQALEGIYRGLYHHEEFKGNLGESGSQPVGHVPMGGRLSNLFTGVT